MRQRSIAVIGVVAVMTAAVVLLQLVRPSTVAGQTQTGAATGTALKTPWGEPDLQGIWTNEFQVPFQRPARFADKEFFTDAEIAALDKERAGSARLGSRVAQKGTVQDVAGAYNTVFTTTKYSGGRTSLVVDPPNGRIPPLTPEAQERRDAIQAFELALLQATDICKNKMPQCAGGPYGPPSPRFAEPGPYYWASTAGIGARNRADGPEDRGLSERCLGFGLPDLGGGVLPYLSSDRAVT